MLRRSLIALGLVALTGCPSSGGGLYFGGHGGSPRLKLLEQQQKEVSKPLSSGAKEVAEREGFVIVPSVSPPSFHFGYAGLFEADQPVYFTADALMHAVHASFDDILIDIERDSLIGELRAFLDEVRSALPKQTKSSPETRAQVDLFLAVAKGLLEGKTAAPVAGASPAAIASLTEKAKAAAGPANVELFGRKTNVDLSMLKPRGHYTRSAELKQYFRSLAWLGRMELRLAESEDGGKMALQPGGLAAAVLISEAMTPRAEKAWQRIDRATDRLVGPADSMSLPAFKGVAAKLNLDSSTVAKADDATVVAALQPIGEQRINTQLLTPFQKTIPLWVFGQRYIADSEVMSATSYGKLPEKRMMPSSFDVAAAIFENPAAHELLEPEYQRFKSLKPAVAKVGQRVDAMGPKLWEGSMSHLWMDALRSLTKEPADGLPKVMTTPSWNRRLLNTQLASWAERRHDTILYAKQSVTMIAGCSFPKAYVDPYPRFYARLVAYAKHGTSVVDELDLPPARKKVMKKYFARLEEVLGTLQAIAVDERAGKPMTSEHLDFMNKAVSVHGQRVGSGGQIAYTLTGWFADLYYRNSSAKFHKPTIVDVHTQPSDEVGNMVGKVLHVGTSRPKLIEVRIGDQRYRGFVSGYHEVVTEKFKRLDDEWMKKQVRENKLAPMPWLKGIAAD